MTKPPKRNLLKQKHKEEMELTKAINADNEEHFAATASSAPGGKLSVVSGGGGKGRLCSAQLSSAGWLVHWFVQN